jgi:hypothetical protein
LSPLEGENVREGWKSLAELLGVSETKAFSLKDELAACGAIFYMTKGRPPQRRMCFWPSDIRKWTRLKGSKGETI